MRGSSVLLMTLVALVGLVGACAKDTRSGGGRLRIVTTVSPITSIVSNIVGDLARVDGIVPEGSNSHTFEPAPSVAETLSKADLIFVNGLKLEDPTFELASKNKKQGARIVELGTTVLPRDDYIYDFSFPQQAGKPNPHLWTDPLYARKYADLITVEVKKADPANAARYQQNHDAFVMQIDALDRALRTASATIPPDKRVLLTYHDAYAYFAKDYGWKVIGAIQVESFQDPTPKQLADLIGQIRATGVPAIFGSEVFPSPVLAQLGRETGVRYIDTLRDDDLPGKPRDPNHSWFGLMRADYITMVDGLGGDAAALKALTVADVAKDTARYPQ